MTARTLNRLATAALAAFAIACAVPALAQHGGGGGSHGGGGGGFHGGGGGGFHAGGGGGFHAGGAFHGGGSGAFHGGGAFRGGAGGVRGGGALNGVVGGFRGSGYRGGGYGRSQNGYGGGWDRGGYGWGHGGYAWGGYMGAGWLGYGLLFSALPLGYDTYYWGNVPYFYADDNYYQWDGAANEYETVQPPDEVASQVAAAAQADSAPIELYAYPKAGQSIEQQAKDRAECQHWATGQAGADATQHGSFLKAEAACLTGKGYSVD